jgi:hypothetical protein
MILACSLFCHAAGTTKPSTQPEGTSRYANAGFDDEAGVDRFISRFRQAVLAHDVDQVAGMIRFPIDVFIDDKRLAINNSRNFQREYGKIFRPDYVARIRAAAPCHMFSRDQGVMFGDRGEVWVRPIQRDGKTVSAVIAINNDIWK